MKASPHHGGYGRPASGRREKKSRNGKPAVTAFMNRIDG
jgi:hypothetical protein